jgi:hypothetical protein
MKDITIEIWKLLLGGSVWTTAIALIIYKLTKAAVKTGLEEKIKYEFAKRLEDYKDDLQNDRTLKSKVDNSIEELLYYANSASRHLRKIVNNERKFSDNTKIELTTAYQQIETLINKTESKLQRLNLYENFHSLKNLLEKITLSLNNYDTELVGNLIINPNYIEFLNVNQKIKNITYNSEILLKDND